MSCSLLKFSGSRALKSWAHTEAISHEEFLLQNISYLIRFHVMYEFSQASKTSKTQSKNRKFLKTLEEDEDCIDVHWK